MNLTGTTHSLELVTSAAVAVDYQVSYTTIDKTGATSVSAASVQGQVASATTTTIVAAPSANVTYTITAASFVNSGAAAVQVKVQKDVAAANYPLSPYVTLGIGEALVYGQGFGWQVLDKAGRLRTQANQDTGTNGTAIAFYKIGTTPEAAGQWYCWSKDSGNPGAWSVGTSGLAGRATDGTTAADNGCFLIKNAAVGTNYLTAFQGATSVACFVNCFDVLWVNNGIVVTTTTAQTINSVAFPARDINGTTNGEGAWIGLLVTTATTNAGAITNTTLSYTNSDGVAGRTATIASFPATGALGTVVWFQLAAGDKGVRSIQTITLGTSYAGGAISLIVAVPLLAFPSTLTNVGGMNVPPQNPGVKLYNGACVLPFALMAAASATTVTGFLTVMER